VVNLFDKKMLDTVYLLVPFTFHHNVRFTCLLTKLRRPTHINARG